MPYLILQDYFRKIQNDDLQQVISNTDNFRIQAQIEALTEMKSYLAQKFDLSDEFRETVKFSYTDTYKAKQLIYLDADAYSALNTYAANALTLANGLVYYCSTPIVAPEAFNAAHWTLIGSQYDLFYVSLPAQQFQEKGIYKTGDLVWRNDNVYQAIKDSVILTHGSQLQYGEYANLPGINEYPEDDGQTQWSAGVPYSFSGVMPNHTSANYTAWSSVTAYTAGQKSSRNLIIWLATGNSTNIIPGTDITKWLPVGYTSGDNRNPMLVGMNVIIAIHKLSPRISPHNVPEVWVKNYDDQVSWLKRCAKGEVTLDMPMLQPAKSRISWGSSIRNVNNY